MVYDDELPVPNANAVLPAALPFPLDGHVDPVHAATFLTICVPAAELFVDNLNMPIQCICINYSRRESTQKFIEKNKQLRIFFVV